MRRRTKKAKRSAKGRGLGGKREVLVAYLEHMREMATQAGDAYTWRMTADGALTYMNGSFYNEVKMFQIQDKSEPTLEEFYTGLCQYREELADKGQALTWEVEEDELVLFIDGKEVERIHKRELPSTSHVTMLDKPMTCPVCGVESLGASAMDRSEPMEPDAGSTMVCGRCGALNVVTEHMGLRRVTKADFDGWDDEFKDFMGKHLRDIRVRQRMGEDMRFGPQGPPRIVNAEDFNWDDYLSDPMTPPSEPTE